MTQQQLDQSIDSYIEQNKEQIAKDIARLVAHPSIDGAAAPGAPFGQPVRAALEEALAIAGRLGLGTNDGGGYVGWAELPGESEACIATVTHVDVVPEGNGWDGDPFALREREGWLLGRGAEDDKGPSILCLHALGFFKSLGVTPRYTLRALLGCNEEKGMADIPHYLAHNPQPVFAFSPDADFPLCNGEKGHFEGDFVSASLVEGHIVELAGGHAANVIPDMAHCVVKTTRQDLAANEWVTPAPAGDGLVRLDARGIGGHAAHPDGTVNAIGRIVEYLLANDLGTPEETTFLALLYKLHCASDGSGLGVACRDEVFDPLTIIGGQICLRDGRIVQNMDSRFPTAITGEGLAEALGALAAQHGATLEVASSVEPFYIPAGSAPIQALLDAYREGTGDAGAKPFTMGGGTYARCLENAVSFGPTFPGAQKPAFVGSVHGANEGAHLDSLLRALKIYINALWKLQQLNY